MAVVSCVPARKVEEMQTKMDKCEEERSQLAKKSQDLETNLSEANSELEVLRSDVKQLQDDTTLLGRS